MCLKASSVLLSSRLVSSLRYGPSRGYHHKAAPRIYGYIPQQGTIILRAHHLRALNLSRNPWDKGCSMNCWNFWCWPRWPAAFGSEFLGSASDMSAAIRHLRERKESSEYRSIPSDFVSPGGHTEPTHWKGRLPKCGHPSIGQRCTAEHHGGKPGGPARISGILGLCF